MSQRPFQCSPKSCRQPSPGRSYTKQYSIPSKEPTTPKHGSPNVWCPLDRSGPHTSMTGHGSCSTPPSIVLNTSPYYCTPSNSPGRSQGSGGARARSPECASRGYSCGSAQAKTPESASRDQSCGAAQAMTPEHDFVPAMASTPNRITGSPLKRHEMPLAHSSIDDIPLDSFGFEEVAAEMTVYLVVQVTGDNKMLKRLARTQVLHFLPVYKNAMKIQAEELPKFNELLCKAEENNVDFQVGRVLSKIPDTKKFKSTATKLLTKGVLAGYLDKGLNCMVVFFHIVKEVIQKIHNSPYPGDIHLEWYKAVRDAAFDACLQYKVEIKEKIPTWLVDPSGELQRLQPPEVPLSENPKVGNPIMVNGLTVTGLPYAFEEIGAELAVSLIADILGYPDLVNVLEREPKIKNDPVFQFVNLIMPHIVSKSFISAAFNKFALQGIKKDVEQALDKSHRVIEYDDVVQDVMTKVIRQYLKQGWLCIPILFYTVKKFTKSLRDVPGGETPLCMYGVIRDSVYIALQQLGPGIDRYLPGGWSYFPYRINQEQERSEEGDIDNL